MMSGYFFVASKPGGFTTHPWPLVPLGEVDQITPQKTSLMPDGLLADLTAQQAADLLAFLESLK